MMAAVARGGQGMARAVQRGVAYPLSAGRIPVASARRSMGGHARHIGLPGEHVPIEVGKLHKNLGTAYLTTMFLWMMYRAKQDGLVLIGMEHPWDHMHHEDDDEPVLYHFTSAESLSDDEEDEEEDEVEDDEE